MAKQNKDENWLKQQLKEALHWDEDVAAGVLGLIVNAKRDDEVQDITAAYMDNHPVAVCAISDFFDARKGGKQQQPQSQPQQQQPPRKQQQQRGGAGSSYSSSVSSAAPQPSAAKQMDAAASYQQDKWLHLGAQPPAAAAEQAPTPAADSVQQVSSKKQAEATLSMFKRGGRLATKQAGAAAGGGGGGATGRRKGEQLDSISSKLERKVANCLSCGKMFDCRNVTNDIIRFIDCGFKCTFCGAAVAMTQQQRIQQAQQQQQHEQDTGSNSSTAPDAAADAQAQAIAFKDRLVDYDRHAQQRTTVIDDQSDFFEIETNAWLSKEERAELRQRAQLEEEAAAARRNKVTVTLDLLGRKVVVADAPDGPAAAGAGAAGSSGSSFQLGGESATQQLLLQVQAAVSQEHVGGGAGSKQEGISGGAAAAGGSQNKAPAETLADALAAISNLRISAHPCLTTTPVFVPKRKLAQPQEHAGGGKAGHQDSQRQHAKPGKQQHKSKQGQKQQAAPSGIPPAKQHAQQRRQLSAAASRAAGVSSRVQDDSIFGDFEAELLCDELLQKQPAQAART